MKKVENLKFEFEFEFLILDFGFCVRKCENLKFVYFLQGGAILFAHFGEFRKKLKKVEKM